jgi:hypothetical protein
MIEVSWLSPKPPLIVGGEAGEQQDCLLACSALAYQSPGSHALRIHAGWALEISDHAAGTRSICQPEKALSLAT